MILEPAAFVGEAERVSAKLILLYAPAGFGKTTLARALSTRYARRLTCDCAGLSDVPGFAKRLLAALGAQPRLGWTEESAWTALALRAWARAGEGTFFVFDNAEDLSNIPAIDRMLDALFARPVTGLTVAICSQARLQLRIGEFAAQHEIITIEDSAVSLLSGLAPEHPSPSDGSSPLRVNVLEEDIIFGGKPLRLTDREFEILIALGTKPIHAKKLSDLIWPEDDAEAARKSLKVYINRLRQKFGERSVIGTGRTGYNFSPAVEVDLMRIDSDIGALSRLRSLTNAQRSLLASHCEALANVRWSRSLHFDWFSQVREHAAALVRKATSQLAHDAVKCGDYERTLLYARLLVTLDPCDEVARDLTIRTLLRGGDRLSALFEYQDYRRVLRCELDAEPSPELASLIQ